MALDEPILIDDAAIDRAAAHLLDRLEAAGLAGPARLAIHAGNQPEFLIARRAAAAGGFVAVPINPKLAPPEIAFVLQSSNAAAVLCPAELRDRLPTGAPLAVAVETSPSGQISGRSLQAVADPAREIGATLIFTSGTTGRPKGCLRLADVERLRARELIDTYAITADDVHLIACPMAHSAPGIFWRAARAVGAATVLLPRFRPEPFLAAVETFRASLFFLVPTQIDRLLALCAGTRDRFDLSSVRAVVVAGAPFPPDKKRAAVSWLGEGKLWEFYGSSETGTVAVMRPGHLLDHPESVGRPPPGVDLQLLAEDGHPVAAGELGEIFVRSPTVMSGYIDGPDPFRDGFLSVGDLGRVDEGGWLTLVDRKYDTIISGGVNVYPAEVERALVEHPAVQGAVVFGVADAEWGQIVAAAVATTVSEDELRRFLRSRIASFKIPKAIALVELDELPVGSSGKPLRRLARERFGPARRS